MSRTIRFIVGEVELPAELRASSTARAIYDALPLEAKALRWGDEIYSEIPLDLPLDPDATETVSVGELAYWSPGNAFCVFFGPTPASDGDEPRAASAVNRVGKLRNDPSSLRSIVPGTLVRLEKVEPG